MDGPCEDVVIKKLQTSTGRTGHLTDLRIDAFSKSYTIEVKNRNLTKWIHDAWILINQGSLDFKLNPVLVLTMKDEQENFVYEGKNRKLSDMHIISESRHRELLAAEQELQKLKTEQLNASI